MDEIRQVLCTHASLYPAMMPQDAVKLLYQGEFGGGHLISDRTQCLRRLKEEYMSTVQRSGIPLFDDLGNGLVRAHLAALDASGIRPETLGRWFIDSSAQTAGRMEVFRKKLGILEALAELGIFSFTVSALRSYLFSYVAAGCPAVSHSEEYRAAYAPAYRVILKQYLAGQ